MREEQSASFVPNVATRRRQILDHNNRLSHASIVRRPCLVQCLGQFVLVAPVRPRRPDERDVGILLLVVVVVVVEKIIVVVDQNADPT